jgi:mannose-6-phosphate isomerase-like protein (cupin superfamily)
LGARPGRAFTIIPRNRKFTVGDEMSIKVNHVILRKEIVKKDWKLVVVPREKNNGRKVFANTIRNEYEKPIKDPEWQYAPEGEQTPVFKTGVGGIEIGTCTEKAAQDRHKHFICTEIYTVLEGKMSIKIDDNPKPITLSCGDEIIVLPGTVHEVLYDENSKFLTRVHSIKCYGDADKYIEKDGVWFQVLTHKNLAKKAN